MEKDVLKQKMAEETTTLIGNIYEDAAKETMIESGKTLATIPQTINALLLPLRKWILEKEYAFEETKILLQKKLENLKTTDIVEPEAYIAVPALEALSYSINNETLRNMYANLLANSMNKNTKDSVHPSFVDIIKQMSPNDAKIFNEIFISKIKPIMDLSTSIKEKKGANNYLYNLTWINTFEYETISLSVSNLLRIGLIEIDGELSYVHDENYSMIRNTKAYKNYADKCNKNANMTLKENKHIIKVTALGELFYKICVSDI